MKAKTSIIAVVLGLALSLVLIENKLWADAQGGNTAGPQDTGKYTIISGNTANGTYPGQIVFTGTSFKFFLTSTTGVQVSGTTNTTF